MCFVVLRVRPRRRLNHSLVLGEARADLLTAEKAVEDDRRVGHVWLLNEEIWQYQLSLRGALGGGQCLQPGFGTDDRR